MLTDRTPQDLVAMARLNIEAIKRTKRASTRFSLRTATYQILAALEIMGHELPPDLEEWLAKKRARLPTHTAADEARTECGQSGAYHVHHRFPRRARCVGGDQRRAAAAGVVAGCHRPHQMRAVT